MPKLVTVWRDQDIQTQARHYVRSYILFPAGLLGLVCMVGGIGALGYQLIASSTYTWTTFVSSSILLLIGALCGWAQTRYHRYLLAMVPDVFAARMRSAVQRTKKKSKGESSIPAIEHPGRRFVPIAYCVGALLLLGGSAWAIFYGAVDAVPAVLMPWAGFYWGKLFFWRGVVN
ncbi:MAG TPA: hypothetical protein VKP13_07050 [Nitrospira sp.]|nr:hypothetical protein [Nitrospira sp.]